MVEPASGAGPTAPLAGSPRMLRFNPSIEEDDLWGGCHGHDSPSFGGGDVAGGLDVSGGQLREYRRGTAGHGGAAAVAVRVAREQEPRGRDRACGGDAVADLRAARAAVAGCAGLSRR